ncbi:MAG TPA: hypothetical protein VN040_01695 [Pseudosphingobacterium sp.]|nr:hypothetical protein [Pseudosphingobacterium sp.]
MKKILSLSLIAFTLVFSSCYSHRTAGRSGKVPPGQAKKVYGKKSAKQFAPGQRKNEYRYYDSH